MAVANRSVLLLVYKKSAEQQNQSVVSWQLTHIYLANTCTTVKINGNSWKCNVVSAPGATELDNRHHQHCILAIFILTSFSLCLFRATNLQGFSGPDIYNYVAYLFFRLLAFFTLCTLTSILGIKLRLKLSTFLASCIYCSF